jgi:hypothetical protein
VAGVAGAGLLLAATGALGAFVYAGWALADHFRGTGAKLNRRLSYHVRTRRTQTAAGGVRTVLTALPNERRHSVETTYFGRVTHEQLVRILFPYHRATTGRMELA